MIRWELWAFVKIVNNTAAEGPVANIVVSLASVVHACVKRRGQSVFCYCVIITAVIVVVIIKEIYIII